MTDLIHQAKSFGCKVLQNEPMSKHTSFKIGGPADFFIEVSNSTQLANVLKLLTEKNIEYFTLGNGSNILVSDKGIRGCVLKLIGEFNHINVDNDIIEVGASVLLSHAAKYALKHSLSGLEFASGIPASMGGAVYMNAGAYGGQMSDIVIECSHITPTGKLITLKNKDIKFEYRHSIYTDKKNIITSVKLQLIPEDTNLIKKTMDDLSKRRKEKQPINLPSAGSVFKRPKEHFAGTLIEQCNLKGVAAGGAMVSEKHAGFIVNYDHASCQNVMDLVQHVQNTVYTQTGVKLESEIKLIGEF